MIVNEISLEIQNIISLTKICLYDRWYVAHKKWIKNIKPERKDEYKLKHRHDQLRVQAWWLISGKWLNPTKNPSLNTNIILVILNVFKGKLLRPEDEHEIVCKVRTQDPVKLTGGRTMERLLIQSREE